MEINLFDDGEPQVQWLSSLTAPNAAHLEIDIMGVSVRLEQDPQARQRSSDDSKVEPMKPSTVGTGVIVGAVSVVELEWGNDAHMLRLGRRFNFIIGCDLLNSEANVEPLVRTLQGVATDDAVILLVDSVRTPASDKAFRRGFEAAGLAVRDVPRAVLDGRVRHDGLDISLARWASPPAPRSPAP